MHRDQLDVPGVDAPGRVAGAHARVLAAGLDGEAQRLVGLHGRLQIRDPVHEMVELHCHILLPRHHWGEFALIGERGRGRRP
jgi:hypothetical protein